MNILILSWEYPPRNIGGISTHVYNLSHKLKEAGHEITVVTCMHEDSLKHEDDNGVNVYRVDPLNTYKNDFTNWVHHLNYAIIEQCNKLLNSRKKFDVIHIHDWLTFFAGKVLKESYNLPLVATLHSTEHGRNNGIYNDMQKYIASVEENMLKQTDKIICCSEFMKDHLRTVFNHNEDNIAVIPNGVIIPDEAVEDLSEFRKNYALENERILFFIGRHVYEKGIQLIIEAAPFILNKYSNTKFIIAGSGAMTEELKDKVAASDLINKFIFTGHMDDHTKNKMLKCADALVIPSLYEPFGIVALEGMAADCAVIASDSGGLKEIILNREDGILFKTGSVYELANSVIELFEDETLSLKLITGAHSKVHKLFSWTKAAELTVKVYNDLAPKKKSATRSRTKKADSIENNKDIETSVTAAKKTRKTTKKTTANSASEQ